MKTSPPRGMNDYLPEEMALRDWVTQQILAVYRRNGYQRIGTPILEDADNLARSEGGENLGLIFQVMKRGAKLEAALREGDSLWDLGLRYDLTLPLARLYAANRQRLPAPFRCIQIGPAYRAERPQRGRLREFIQCDIDILGEANPFAELELIAVTAEALLALGFEGFTVLMNDRRVLLSLLSSFGFAAERCGEVAIALDKLDKVGMDGVRSELLSRDMPPKAVEAMARFFAAPVTRKHLAAQLSGDEALENLLGLIDALAPVAQGQWQTALAPTLVRGQGYYTGPVFEMALPGYPGSIAGGGRYDRMIGSFTGEETPAVGFSIGFERIVDLLALRKAATAARPRLALLYENQPFDAVFSRMRALGEQYDVTAIRLAAQVGKQRKRLALQGFGFVMDMDAGEATALK